jgi:hypothetical protein
VLCCSLVDFRHFPPATDYGPQTEVSDIVVECSGRQVGHNADVSLQVRSRFSISAKTESNPSRYRISHNDLNGTTLENADANELEYCLPVLVETRREAVDRLRKRMPTRVLVEERTLMLS